MTNNFLAKIIGGYQVVLSNSGRWRLINGCGWWHLMMVHPWFIVVGDAFGWVLAVWKIDSPTNRLPAPGLLPLVERNQRKERPPAPPWKCKCNPYHKLHILQWLKLVILKWNVCVIFGKSTIDSAGSPGFLVWWSVFRFTYYSFRSIFLNRSASWR